VAAPKGLCYGNDSEIGRYLAAAKDERSKYLVIDDGSLPQRTFRITTQASPRPQSAVGATGTAPANEPAPR
jgi:hypothetical protein